ncbi:MAG: hypothetical protein IT280_10425 [Ignavibacteria bacterium]|nr:hypothetical protein [Ignavibacteria bacterium]
MFQDFAKRKFNDYLSMVSFPAGRITFEQIWSSALPPFIKSFLENYIPKHNIPIDKKDFEDVLEKAVVFNINYIIKPKNTLIKFLFGEIETRPTSYILNRLKYFQFYGYYITNIEDFISLNSLEVISVTQIELLLDEVNSNIYKEISGSRSQAHRMNLVKLLYYFFHDLGTNNPVNIKLPRKILSAYFADKGFNEIKQKIDTFFSDEIFIQEAVELMNPESKKLTKENKDYNDADDKVMQIISKAKTEYTNRDNAEREIEKILKADREIIFEEPEVNIKLIREQEAKSPVLDKSQKYNLPADDVLYSDDLLFASQFNEITPPSQISEADKRIKLIDDLFCETSYKKKIIKKLFRKNEDEFLKTVNNILDKNNWAEAVVIIENHFKKNKIDLYSNEAVKFVDILQSDFPEKQ